MGAYCKPAGQHNSPDCAALHVTQALLVEDHGSVRGSLKWPRVDCTASKALHTHCTGMCLPAQCFEAAVGLIAPLWRLWWRLPAALKVSLLCCSNRHNRRQMHGSAVLQANPPLEKQSRTLHFLTCCSCAAGRGSLGSTLSA